MSTINESLLTRIKYLIKNENPRKFKKFDTAVLDQSGDADLKKLKDALWALTSEDSWTPEETAQFKKIDAIKEAYLNSPTQVTIKDFGAGTKKALYNKDGMESGMDKTVVIAKTVRTDATPVKWGKLLFKIVREFKSQHCLELGTNLGMSAAYQVAALKLNQSGHLTTIEGAEPYAKLAEQSLKTLDYPNFNVYNGRFSDVLPTILKKEQPIDFAFIDGHHDGVATQMYFETIYPYLAPKAVLVFDDIYWSDSMKDAWQKLYQNKKIKISVDVHKWGICLVDKNAEVVQPKYFKVSL